jgi:alkylhydroperoxidase/carboxymuconolactone decarboxylase family protein YurZ
MSCYRITMSCSRGEPVEPEQEVHMRDMHPGHFQRFKKAQPEIYEAFEELGRRIHETGPLTERERRLVKLGIAIGLRTEGGVHSAVRFALSGGCSREDISHAARLAITTIGWPSALAAMSWVDELLDGENAPDPA